MYRLRIIRCGTIIGPHLPKLSSNIKGLTFLRHSVHVNLGSTVLYSVLERRQTMLFSATQTRKIEDLARISLKKEPLYIGVDDQKDKATVEGLEQVR